MNSLEQKKFLLKVLKAYSPTGKEKKVAIVLNNYFKKMGFKSRIDSVGNVVAIKGNGNKTLLFLGHMDTVPGKIRVREEKKRIFGRGSVDAKSCIVSFAIAAAKTKTKNLKIVLAACVEEESNTSKGGRHIISKYTPDFVVVGEPSSINAITIGYKGIAYIEFKAKTEMVHTSSETKNAIEICFDLWQNLKKIVEKQNQNKKMFESIQLFPVKLKEKHNNFFHEAELFISMRTPEKFKPKKLERQLKKTGFRKIRVLEKEKAVRSDKNNLLVRAYLKAIRKNKLKPVFKIKSGTSDFNIAKRKWKKTPIIAFGPGNSRLDHTPNEHITLKEFFKSIKINQTAIKELDKTLKKRAK